MILSSSGGAAGSQTMGTDASLSLNFLTKPALNCPLFRKQFGVKLFAQTQINLGVFGGALPLKTKLMHCVLSGSDVGKKIMILLFFYITKLQITCITCKTLSLQLLERGENDGLRTTGWRRKYDNTGQSFSGCGRGRSNMTSYCSENQNGLIIETV